jgi:hypothetical protein
VEEKRASTKRRCPWVAERGNQRRIPPVRITAAKLRTKILVGDKCLERNVLNLILSSISGRLLCYGLVFPNTYQKSQEKIP